eukprot:gene5231-5889_t
MPAANLRRFSDSVLTRQSRFQLIDNTLCWQIGGDCGTKTSEDKAVFTMKNSTEDQAETQNESTQTIEGLTENVETSNKNTKLETGDLGDNNSNKNSGDDTTRESSSNELQIDNRPPSFEPDFTWDSRLQGVVLGSFYYGYMVLQIPGGYMAMKIGGTRIFGFGVLFASIFTIFTPPATRFSVWALVALRVAEGLSLGVMLPCNHQIWSFWAPRAERTILVTIAVAGMNVGTIVTMPLTGLLTKYGFDGGWASVFYCFGAAGIVWWIVWMAVIHDFPSTHPSISKEERNYIERNVDVHEARPISLIAQ